MSHAVLTHAQALARGGSIAPADPERALTMAGIDPGDLQMFRMASRGIGVVTGGAATAPGGMVVRIAPTTVVRSDLAWSEYATNNDVTLPSASGATQDRWYLITSSGVFGLPAYQQGGLADPYKASPPQAGPLFPGFTEPAWCAVFVPAGTTAITADHIVDKRVDVLDPATLTRVVNTGGVVGTPRPGGTRTGCVVWQHASTTKPTNFIDGQDIWISGA